MAITEVKVVKWGGSASGAGPLSARQRYQLVYKVTCSSPNDGPQTIFKYFRQHIVWFGGTYRHGNDFDNTARCNSIQPELIDKSGGQWLVTAGYENPQAEQPPSGTDASGNPVDDPTLFHDEIEVSHTQLSVPVWKAVFFGGMKGRAAQRYPVGSTIVPCNSAGVPFDPPLEDVLDIKVVRITKNRLAYTAVFDDFLNSINTGTVHIDKPLYRYRDVWQPGAAKIVSHESRFMLYRTFPYWKESVEVHIHPKSWIQEVLDQGLDRRAAPGDKRRDGTTISASDIKPGMPELERATDEDGNPVATPLPLDGDGQFLVGGGPPVWLKYLPEQVKLRNFNIIDW